MLFYGKEERGRGEGGEGHGGSRGMEGKRQFLIVGDYFAHGKTTDIPGFFPLIVSSILAPHHHGYQKRPHEFSISLGAVLTLIKNPFCKF